MIRRTHPIHPEIHCILDWQVPIPLWQRIFIVDNVANGMAVLEASKFTFSISHTQNKVASPFGCLHPMDGLIEGRVPLEYISEHEGERVAESALFTESIIRVGDANF